MIRAVPPVRSHIPTLGPASVAKVSTPGTTYHSTDWMSRESPLQTSVFWNHPWYSAGATIATAPRGREASEGENAPQLAIISTPVRVSM